MTFPGFQRSGHLVCEYELPHYLSGDHTSHGCQQSTATKWGEDKFPTV